jgi:predicted dehydrogenase
MNSENPPADTQSTSTNSLTRRNFLRSTGGVGAGLIVTSKTLLGQEKANGGRSLKIAMIGCGSQGKKLQESMSLVEPEKHGAGFDGITFIAVCDINPIKREYMSKLISRTSQKEGPEPIPYEDATEMFEKHQDLDAVLIACPDWKHHFYSIMAMEAGCDVYCEKMMSNSIESAREMCQVQRKTGKLLQIGHQRRSNPRYMHLRNNIIHKNNLLGYMTHCSAQWNRGVKSSLPLGYTPDQLAKLEAEDPKVYARTVKKIAKAAIPAETLAKYGYEDMFTFDNWRMYKKYGGGAISDLGAHQIDLFNWFYGTLPKSVMASGGIDFYGLYEHYDNVMCIYEYETPWSTWSKAPSARIGGGDTVTSRCHYQVLTTTGSEGFYEKVMGEHGSAAINETAGLNQIWKESSDPRNWDDFAKPGENQLVSREGVVNNDPVYHKVWENPKPWTRPTPWLDTKNLIDSRVSKPPEQFELPVVLNEKAHSLHLLNFFDTTRKQGKQEELNCPAEEGFRTCVTVLKVNESIETGQKIVFKPEDFAI